MFLGEFYKAALFGVRVSRTLECVAFHYDVPLFVGEQRADAEVGGFWRGFAGQLDCTVHDAHSYTIIKGCKRKLRFVGMMIHGERKSDFSELIGDFLVGF